MPTGLTSDQLQSLARLGAQQRIAELEEEIAAIRRAFSGGVKTRRRRGASSGTSPAPAKKRRGRRKMSAEARRAVSERMSRYWAERRKQKAGGKR